ncbi:Peptide deformylase [Desulfamplus magnetovallimortis]|uniref:Peptide deformylase n=1 Tax=Desulfamplus magnetovallimortis TaxID=1246637 RepID=A0A1W1HJ05_9BACT|nr:peptide deformylase [Desulfamplus magnetovallimortis]SLM32481.1 Peptide deformylase [Desulfamplus magnetovallimortis]
MALLKILEYPDPFLLRKAVPVENIDKETLLLIEDMIDTMFDAPGVGLAAPQIGSDKRIIVYNTVAGVDSSTEDCEKQKNEKELQEADHKNETTQEQENTSKDNVPFNRNDARAIINPEIVSASGSLVSESEACLSVPDFNANVKRFSRITVKGLNIDGKKIQFDAEDIQAVILQHEIDHLNGILYIDHISVLKRNMYKKKIMKRLKSK